MKKSISILIPDLRGGGAERVAVNLANGFIQRGYVVEMVLMSASGEFMSNLLPEVRVVDLHVKKLRGVFFPLVRYLRQAKPDAFLACMWPLTVIAVWARFLALVSTRVVVAEHTTWSRSKIFGSFIGRWLARVTMRLTFPSADGLVAVSRGAADDLARFSHIDRKDITVIYNPVVDNTTPEIKQALPPPGWWLGAHRRVLAVGTLKSVKGYANLLNAFANLCERVDARLLILGEGDCRSELQELAKRLGIEARLFLPGFVADPALYYLHADLHVLPSIAEGLPTVIIEALAAGTPVVSTDCPSGPREILCDGEFGVLVPVGDSAALSMAMFDALSNTHDCEVLKKRAQNFSIDEGVDHYLELLFPRFEPDSLE